MFAPVDPAIREKVISAHLSGQGRNSINRQLKIEGVRVSHGSISNIIKRYKREHELPLQTRSQQKKQPLQTQSSQEQQSPPKQPPPIQQLPNDATISSGVNINKTDGSPSSVGDGLTVPIINSPIVNDSAIHRDSDPEVNINQPNDVIINQHVKEDEFIEEEEQEQQRRPERRFTLSDAKITSGSSYNRNRDQDQDQEKGEEPPIDLSRKFDWDARTQEESRNLKSVNVIEQDDMTEDERKYYRRQYGSKHQTESDSQDLIDWAARGRPKPIIDLDSDESTERGVIHFINTDREQRRREIQLINQGWQELENERHRVEQMKQSIEQRENNLKVREIKIADVESLAPSLRQLQQMGADFFMIQSYILLVNERSVLGNIDTRQAAIFLSHEFRELGNLGGILKEKLKAKKELSELNMLITHKQHEVAAFSGGNGNNINGYSGGLSASDYIRLHLLRQSTVNILNRMVH